MATEKQIEANRRNAQKSSGPRTDAGKQASSRNSFKLGIYMSDVALFDDPESAADLERTFHEYLDSLQPINALERELSTCKVQLRRLGRIGNGLLNDARERAFGETCSPDKNGKPVSRFDRSQYPPEEQRLVANLHLAAGWVKVHDYLETISRQESRLATRYRHAQNAWLQLVQSREVLSEPMPVAIPGPEPAPIPESTPESVQELAPESAPEPAQPVEPVLQNEPNFAEVPLLQRASMPQPPLPSPLSPTCPPEPSQKRRSRDGSNVHLPPLPSQTAECLRRFPPATARRPGRLRLEPLLRRLARGQPAGVKAAGKFLFDSRALLSRWLSRSTRDGKDQVLDSEDKIPKDKCLMGKLG
jgi:hypothetical protein